MGSRSVANQLTQMIQSGQAAIGSYLPPTRQLASQFGVSLHTVGVALKQLETQRLVECLPRQGARVRSRHPMETIETGLRHIAVVINNERDWLYARHLTSEWGGQIIHHLEQELFGEGFTLATLFQAPLEAEGDITLEQRLDRLGPTLHGAVCFGTPGVLDLIHQLQKRDVPWVAINQPSREINHNYIAADNHRAGWKVGRLFAECGYEKVLLLNNTASRLSSDADKLTGVFQGYIESGTVVDGLRPVPCGGYFEMNGYRATKDLLDEGNRPQAVFATGDFLAAGAIHALRDAGLSVPQDVNVIGATGMQTSAHMDPPLSVVAQPMEKIGRAAGQMLREMINEGTRQYAPRRIDCPLILRDSTNVSDETKQKLSELFQPG
jgi:DNA-binding LacI/PurR family transcriptional regulator